MVPPSAVPCAPRVLLVEDDEAVLRALERALVGRATVIRVASDANANIAASAMQPDRLLAEVDACDVLVAGTIVRCGGAEPLFAAVRARRPDVRCVLISAGASAESPHANAVLQKPFTLDELRRAILG